MPRPKTPTEALKQDMARPQQHNAGESEPMPSLSMTPGSGKKAESNSPASAKTIRPKPSPLLPSLGGFLSRVRAGSNSTTPLGTARSPFMSPKSPKSPKSPSSLKSLMSFTSSLTRRKSSNRPTILNVKPLQHRTDLPPWDRTTDIVYHNYPIDATYRPDKAEQFDNSLDLFYTEHGRRRIIVIREWGSFPCEFFLLSPANRLRVWRTLITSLTGDKPVALTGRPWLKDAWRHDEFVTLGYVLHRMKPYLEANFELRAEAMVALLMTKRFHVTYSPFVGQNLNPAAVLWLRKYAPYMQHLTVELDFTTLGFSHIDNAELLPPGIVHMKEHIKALAGALRKKKHVSTMECLVLMCRRYYGNRRTQVSPTRNGFPPTPSIEGACKFTDLYRLQPCIE
jgi:hypothetical protein